MKIYIFKIYFKYLIIFKKLKAEEYPKYKPQKNHQEIIEAYFKEQNDLKIENEKSLKKAEEMPQPKNLLVEKVYSNSQNDKIPLKKPIVFQKYQPYINKNRDYRDKNYESHDNNRDYRSKSYDKNHESRDKDYDSRDKNHDYRSKSHDKKHDSRDKNYDSKDKNHDDRSKSHDKHDSYDHHDNNHHYHHHHDYSNRKYKRNHSPNSNSRKRYKSDSEKEEGELK